jgi:hypothetical protein
MQLSSTVSVDVNETFETRITLDVQKIFEFISSLSSLLRMK